MIFSFLARLVEHKLFHVIRMPASLLPFFLSALQMLSIRYTPTPTPPPLIFPFLSAVFAPFVSSDVHLTSVPV